MTRAAGRTSSGPTATVAMEQAFPPGQRIVDDDLAYPILPKAMRAIAWLFRPAFMRDWMVRYSEKAGPGAWGGLMCRKRYIDEKLIESADQIEAVVNLGAGYDTRAYRLTELANLHVWEVDQPHNIDAKRARLQALFGEVPAHVTLVPIDFDRQELAATLAAHGYSAEMRTFFILEGVTQYLTQAGIDATFGLLANAAPGSRLAFTYSPKDFLDGVDLHGQPLLYKRYVVHAKLWLWGLDPERASEFLAQYGWRLAEHPTYEELGQRYVKPTGRDLASMSIERMAYAEKI